METLKSTLLSLIESPLQEEGFELVDLVVGGRSRSCQIQIFIDKGGGISVDDCAFIDRMISGLLDARMPDLEHYRLEISSPGIDRPLKTSRDFRRHTGRKVCVRYQVRDHAETVTGVIADVSEEAVMLQLPDSGKTAVPLTDIIQAKVILEWKQEG